jgi:hypothetical protein
MTIFRKEICSGICAYLNIHKGALNITQDEIDLFLRNFKMQNKTLLVMQLTRVARFFGTTYKKWEKYTNWPQNKSNGHNITIWQYT